MHPEGRPRNDEKSFVFHPGNGDVRLDTAAFVAELRIHGCPHRSVQVAGRDVIQEGKCTGSRYLELAER